VNGTCVKPIQTIKIYSKINEKIIIATPNILPKWLKETNILIYILVDIKSIRFNFFCFFKKIICLI